MEIKMPLQPSRYQNCTKSQDPSLNSELLYPLEVKKKHCRIIVQNDFIQKQITEREIKRGTLPYLLFNILSSLEITGHSGRYTMCCKDIRSCSLGSLSF